MDLIAAFRLFIRTLPHGAETERHKIKDDSEIKREKKINRRGRDILRMFDTFLNPLLSRCRLPVRAER